MKKVHLLATVLLTGLFCFVLTLSAQKKNQGGAGLSWEYKYILRHREFDRNVQDSLSVAYHREASYWNQCAEDDKPVACPSMPDKLAQLGSAGWELVTVTPRSSAGLNGYSGATTDDVWIFKRPKQ